MNIALIGYGKMGKAIEAIAIEKGHKISLKIDLDNTGDLTNENLKKCDVAIEFTTPGTAVKNITRCFTAEVPVVSGTTGWLNQMEEVKKSCIENNGTLLWTSNFSIGVNIFFEINKFTAGLMERYRQYNVGIEETHHTQKKDAPSGTAITIAEQVLQQIHTKKSWVNNATGVSDDLEIISKRIDPAAGTHSVKYTSAVDDIELIHTAHNRTGFAEGAVLAAEFLKGKKGIFTMKEVLGF